MNATTRAGRIIAAGRHRTVLGALAGAVGLGLVAAPASAGPLNLAHYERGDNNTSWLMADLRPVGSRARGAAAQDDSGPTGLLRFKASGRRAMSDVALTGLEPGRRFTVAASSITGCNWAEVVARPRGLLGTMYGGDGKTHRSVAARSVRRTTTVLTERIRSFVVIVGGRVRACGAARSLDPRRPGRLRTLRIHPIQGHDVRGLIHLTRTAPSRWSVRGVLAGADAADVRLALSTQACEEPIRDSGWGAIPRGVVDSEGWDEVPEDMMFQASAGVVAGSLSGGLPARSAAAYDQSMPISGTCWS